MTCQEPYAEIEMLDGSYETTKTVFAELAVGM